MKQIEFKRNSKKKSYKDETGKKSEVVYTLHDLQHLLLIIVLKR